MSTMVNPENAPEYLLLEVARCRNCEADRRPRMFVCDYHEGWWDGYDARDARSSAEQSQKGVQGDEE